MRALNRSHFYRLLGENVQAARTARGITQRCLSIEAGLSRAGIANIERGHGGIAVDRLMKIARVLRVDIADLIPGRRTKEEPKR